MKVLFVNPFGDVGGAERSLLDLMQSLQAHGVEAELLCLSEGTLPEKAEKLGFRTYLLPLPSRLLTLGDGSVRNIPSPLAGVPALPGYASRLHRHIRDVRPHIVHSNGVKSHLLCGLMRTPPCPVVWHVRDFLSHRRLPRRVFPWLTAPHALVAISKAVGVDASAMFPANLVHVIYNAIDTQHFQPGAADGACLDGAAGLSPPAGEVLRIGLVATFARWKGQDVFLAAAHRLLRDCPNVRFYIVGGAIYRTQDSQFSVLELQTLASENAASIGFVPYLDDPLEAYRALDIVVHASTRAEPFGRTIAEAMACGRPVVVAAAGGAGEIIRHDVDAIGVPPGDPEALAQALKQLVSAPERRRNLAAQARVSAVERFSRERLGQEVFDLYTRLTSV